MQKKNVPDVQAKIPKRMAKRDLIKAINAIHVVIVFQTKPHKGKD